MRFKKVFKPLSQEEERAFSKVTAILKIKRWDGITELDENWGWIVLADKSFPESGVILRRIKPFNIKSGEDMERAKRLQETLRKDSIEIHPYKITRDKNGTRKIFFYEPLFSLLDFQDKQPQKFGQNSLEQTPKAMLIPFENFRA